MRRNGNCFFYRPAKYAKRFTEINFPPPLRGVGSSLLPFGPWASRPRTPLGYFLCEQKVPKKSFKPAV